MRREQSVPAEPRLVARADSRVRNSPSSTQRTSQAPSPSAAHGIQQGGAHQLVDGCLQDEVAEVVGEPAKTSVVR